MFDLLPIAVASTTLCSIVVKKTDMRIKKTLKHVLYLILKHEKNIPLLDIVKID